MMEDLPGEADIINTILFTTRFEKSSDTHKKNSNREKKKQINLKGNMSDSENLERE